MSLVANCDSLRLGAVKFQLTRVKRRLTVIVGHWDRYLVEDRSTELSERISCSQLFLKGNLRQCDVVQTYSIDIPMAGRGE